MATDKHDHDHSHLDEMDLRVRALETVLVEKGYIDPAALDVLVDTYQTKIGPRNGARVVARAWVDPAYHQWLLHDATAAIASLGYSGRQGEHMVVVENTSVRHNLVVCTLCSVTPGRCLACRRSGTRVRRTDRAWSGIRAVCWPNSGLRYRWMWRFGCGIRPPKCAI